MAHSQVDLLSSPATIGGQEQQALWYYIFWKQVSAVPARYKAKKQTAVDALIDHLEKYFPSLRRCGDE